MFHLKAKNNGQSLTEYSLVIGLVALASIAGVALLATTIQQNMTQSVQQEASFASQDQALISKNLSSPSSPAQNTPVTQGIGNLPTENLCLSGVCANFPIVNAHNDLVDVAAGEGADRIHQFANTLNELAGSIEAAPHSDPTLARMIRELASSGHTIGDTQKKFLGNRQDMKVAVEYNNSTNRFHGKERELNNYLNQNTYPIASSIKDLLLLQANQIKNLSAGVTASYPRQMTSLNVRVKEGSESPRLIHQSANTICEQQSNQTCFRKNQS